MSALALKKGEEGQCPTCGLWLKANRDTVILGCSQHPDPDDLPHWTATIKVDGAPPAPTK